MTYDDIKREIEGAPATWIPGLLRAAVEAAIKNGVFVAGGMEKFIARIVEGKMRDR